MDRALVSGTKGRRFESGIAYHNKINSLGANLLSEINRNRKKSQLHSQHKILIDCPILSFILSEKVTIKISF
jgi:hypothetical protein